MHFENLVLMACHHAFYTRNFQFKKFIIIFFFFEKVEYII